jgi:hypothetical protein
MDQTNRSATPLQEDCLQAEAMVPNREQPPTTVTPDHGFDDPENQSTNDLLDTENGSSVRNQTNLSASPLANRTNLPTSSPEQVPRPNDIITWARQVSSKHKLDFVTHFHDTAKFYNSLLEEAVQMLLSDTPTVSSLPIPSSIWMVLNDLDRRKSFRDDIKQKLQSINACFWKGSLDNGRLAFKKMTPLQMDLSILTRITALVSRSKKKQSQDEITNSFLVDTIRRAPREEALQAATSTTNTTAPFTLDSPLVCPFAIRLIVCTAAQ